MDSVPYREPTNSDLLALASLFVVVNLARVTFDRIGHVGILGELATGIIYGVPLAGWVSVSVQETLIQLGYIGLIGIVFHGGLTTDLNQAKRTLGLAFLTAATGMLVPIGLSFLLLRVAFDYDLLASFAAGAALASTSLGTSLAVLKSAGLDHTRVGALLFSTALIDDVISLLLLQLVVALANSQNNTQNIGWKVSRPIVASVGLLVLVYILSKWILRPLLAATRSRLPVSCEIALNLVCLALAPFAAVSAALYAGTSALLGAFTGGIALAYLDTSSVRPHFRLAFESHLAQTLEYVLAPLFFLSIGFAVPIRRMFVGETVWRGFLYALLMLVGKLVVGIWVPIAHVYRHYLDALSRQKSNAGAINLAKVPLQAPKSSQDATSQDDTPQPTTTMISEDLALSKSSEQVKTSGADIQSSPPVEEAESHEIPRRATTPSIWLPTLVLGSALVSRGEIGLIILQTALSARALPNAVFLIGIWAVLLNTLLGPIAVAVLARHAKAGLMPSEWA